MGRSPELLNGRRRAKGEYLSITTNHIRSWNTNAHLANHLRARRLIFIHAAISVVASERNIASACIGKRLQLLIVLSIVALHQTEVANK